MTITYLIIGFTALVSFMAFSNHDLNLKLRHWPYREHTQNEYYRWLTVGFLHADPMHLIFNMFSLLIFGGLVEEFFDAIMPGLGGTLFLFFYLLSIVAASSGSYYQNRENPSYTAVGASGGVAAVVFAAILFQPTLGIGMFLIPIRIPGFIFGILYLWYCTYAARRGGDNIGHAAHFFGAVFGFFFPMLLQHDLLWSFLDQIVEWFKSFSGN